MASTVTEHWLNMSMRKNMCQTSINTSYPFPQRLMKTKVSLFVRLVSLDRRCEACGISTFRFPSFKLTSPLTSFKGYSSQPEVSLEENEESQAILEENETEGEDNHHVDNNAAVEAIREAVLKFTEEDLEEACKKYDMEEELCSEIDYAQVNAFTDRPFSGNPAAVCYLPLKRSDRWLQLVAREFNLSETTFLIKRNPRKKGPVVQKKEVSISDTEDEFDLRWFTPKVEVDLCGHATLASAHLLFTSRIAEGDTIVFHTKSGILRARKISGYEHHERAPAKDDDNFGRGKRRPSGVGTVELDFPLVPAMQCNDKELSTLSEILGGVEVLWVGKTSLGGFLVEVSSKDLEMLRPEFSKMLDLDGRGGVIVTASAPKNSDFDFVSRFFCPKAGINEVGAWGIVVHGRFLRVKRHSWACAREVCPSSYEHQRYSEIWEQ